jgi:uncharacterized protein YndB with AHSA1/START domain
MDYGGDGEALVAREPGRDDRVRDRPARRELVPDERIVSTEVFEGMPDAPALDTTTFTEVDGRTTVSILVQHTSRGHRDAHLESGMEDGLQDAMALLDEVVASLG